MIAPPLPAVRGGAANDANSEHTRAPINPWRGGTVPPDMPGRPDRNLSNQGVRDARPSRTSGRSLQRIGPKSREKPGQALPRPGPYGRAMWPPASSSPSGDRRSSGDSKSAWSGQRRTTSDTNAAVVLGVTSCSEKTFWPCPARRARRYVSLEDEGRSRGLYRVVGTRVLSRE